MRITITLSLSFSFQSEDGILDGHVTRVQTCALPILKVLDGGISGTSRDTLSKLVNRFGESVRLEFVTVDPSVFGKATPGPGQSHMAYCRILLPRSEERRVEKECRS